MFRFLQPKISREELEKKEAELKSASSENIKIEGQTEDKKKRGKRNQK